MERTALSWRFLAGETLRLGHRRFSQDIVDRDPVVPSRVVRSVVYAPREQEPFAGVRGESIRDLFPEGLVQFHGLDAWAAARTCGRCRPTGHLDIGVNFATVGVAVLGSGFVVAHDV